MSLTNGNFMLTLYSTDGCKMFMCSNVMLYPLNVPRVFSVCVERRVFAYFAIVQNGINTSPFCSPCAFSVFVVYLGITVLNCQRYAGKSCAK